MARKADPTGPSTRQLIEDAPIELAHAVLTAEKIEGAADIDFPFSSDGESEEDCRRTLLQRMAKLDRELLRHIEERCRQVFQLSEGKGVSSLDTVADQHLGDDDLEIYRNQVDALSRSIWTYLNHRDVFEDAESFHAARRFRDYGKLYDAFEVDLDTILDRNSGSIDCERLGAAMTEALDLKTPCTVRAVDLPEADPYPPSVMIIVRHGGPLSSVHDHRSDGHRRTIYFRPANEATLIYTSKHRKIEVCSDSRPVRHLVARCFAEVALNHDVSSKPLTWKSYDLSRFRASLKLPVPSITSFELTVARVIEVTVQLDNGKRYLTLKVAVEDDIDEVATRYLGSHSALQRADRITRIRIAVRYHRLGDMRERSLSITVTDTSSCNVQSIRDPEERRLGFALLEAWGVMQAFQPIDAADLRALFPRLTQLYERIDEEVSGALLRDLRLDSKQLISAGLLERSGRDERVLVEDGGVEGEAEVGAGRDHDLVRLTDTYGQDAGELPADLFRRYRLNTRWLLETLVSLMKPLLVKQATTVLDEDLTALGNMNINGVDVPTYFARRLDQTKTLNRLDQLLRSRSSGIGLILSASVPLPRCLGPNVVVPLQSNFLYGDKEAVVSRESIVLEFSATRNLAIGGSTPAVLRSGPQSGTLYIPGRNPLALTGANQIRVFERLVAARNAGSADVKAVALLEGTNCRSPSQAFRSEMWAGMVNVYIAKGAKNGYWRIPD